MEIPVYLFTGFLEAGKTKFIRETMQDPGFNDGKKNFLILSCESGEEEYEAGELGENVSLLEIDDPSLLTPVFLEDAAKKAKADIVVVEYNGMWMLDAFYNALPENFMVYQEILIIDATTIESYNANMRQLVADKLTSCEMTVFNRVSPTQDKLPLHKLVRGISRKANICYEAPDGQIEFDQFEDPLPFDMNADVIEIADVDFAIFYREMTEDFSKFAGRKVRFKGIVATDGSLPSGQYAIGRHIMTCCAADITYRGVVAKGTCGLKLTTRDWITVEGTLAEEYSKLYRAKGPVLTVTSAKRAEKPEEEVCTFY